MSSKYLWVFCMLCAVIIACNAFAFLKQYRQWRQQPSQGLHTLGYKFLGLENLFKGLREVGYVTDRNLEEPLSIAQYELAQYILAPTKLVLNQTNYPFVLVDCTTPESALQHLKAAGLKAAKVNAGIILAVNPAFAY